MDLRDKLSQLEPHFKKAPQARPVVEKEDIGRLVDGERIESIFGSYFLATTDYPISHCHGHVALSSIASANPDIYRWVGKDTQLQGLDYRSALFLDTETTGLAGGAGTVPFMIGLGFFHEDLFRVEQYFIEDFNQERAMLQGVYDRLSESKALVTYNGKCYDINLLISRFTLARMKSNAESLAHLDLLFTSRRLWRKRLQDCSLSNIEKHILGFKRHDDVPGFMIPSLYFEYLRTGRIGKLAAVFDHNRWDIVSLAALAAYVASVYQEPAGLAPHAEDLFSLGRSYLSMEAYEQAVFCLSHPLIESLDKPDYYDAQQSLALMYKRQEAWEKAIPIWRKLIQTGSYQSHPYEELAKYYEHRMDEIESAKEVVMQAIERINMIQDLKPHLSFEMDRRDLEYRLARLVRKQKH